jgi:ATP-binding cassette, subfamily B, bacterial
VAGRLAFALRLCWQTSRGPMIVLACMAPVQGLTPVGYAWLTHTLIDALAVGSRPAVIDAVAGLILVTAVLLGLTPLSRFAGEEMSRRLTTRAQADLYSSIVRLPSLAALEDPAYLNRVRLAQQAAISGPQQALTGLLSLVQALVTLTGFIVALASLDGWIAVLIVASAIPELAAELRLGRRRADLLVGTAMAQRRVSAFGFLLVDPRAAAEIQTFGAGRLLHTRMLELLRQVSDGTRARNLAEAWARGALAVLGALAAGGGLALTAVGALHHELTLGDVAVVLAALSALQAGLSGAVGTVAEMSRELILLDHYRFVLSSHPSALSQAPPRRQAVGRGPSVPGLTLGLELRDVWFRHGDGQPWVLRGVSLTMPAGRSVALVGPNGAGKSTIVKLLCRLYEPVQGAILWDGVNITELSLHDLRRRIAVVFQDFVTYELTGAENIGVGDVERMHELLAVQRAAAEAGIHDAMTALDRGYDTLLSRVFFADEKGQAGTTLSTGQAQRLAVARALFRDRDRVSLVILDEPASGLDPDAEHELHCRFRELRRHHTTLLISHRLAAVREAETIAVLDRGQIIETGSHDELIANGGRYAAMFRVQAAGYAGLSDDSPIRG